MSDRAVDAVTSVRAGDITLCSLSFVSRPALICARAGPSSLALTSDDLPCSPPRFVPHARVVLLASAGHYLIIFSPLRGDTPSALRPYTRVRPPSL